jgi:hypothetical protein
MQSSTTFTFNALVFALTASLVAGCGDDGGVTHDHTTGDTTGTGEGTTHGSPTSETQSEGTDAMTGSTTIDPDDSTSDASTTEHAESSSSDSTGEDVLEIVGDWVEAHGGGAMTTHTITSESWTQASDFGTFGYALGTFDNAERWVVGEDEGDGTYSRFDWVWDGDDELHYCTAAFGQDTVQEAIDAPKPDAADLQAGCSGFAWSHLQAD